MVKRQRPASPYDMQGIGGSFGSSPNLFNTPIPSNPFVEEDPMDFVTQHSKGVARGSTSSSRYGSKFSDNVIKPMYSLGYSPDKASHRNVDGSPLTEQQYKDFFDKFVPLVVAVAGDNRRLAQYLLSKKALESNFGTKAFGYNAGGIKARAQDKKRALSVTREQLDTKEPIPGKRYLKNDDGSNKILYDEATGRWNHIIEDDFVYIDDFDDAVARLKELFGPGGRYYNPDLESYDENDFIYQMGKWVASRGYSTEDPDNYGRQIANMRTSDPKKINEMYDLLTEEDLAREADAASGRDPNTGMIPRKGVDVAKRALSDEVMRRHISSFPVPAAAPNLFDGYVNTMEEAKPMQPGPVAPQEVSTKPITEAMPPKVPTGNGELGGFNRQLMQYNIKNFIASSPDIIRRAAVDIMNSDAYYDRLIAQSTKDIENLRMSPDRFQDYGKDVLMQFDRQQNLLERRMERDKQRLASERKSQHDSISRTSASPAVARVMHQLIDMRMDTKEAELTTEFETAQSELGKQRMGMQKEFEDSRRQNLAFRDKMRQQLKVDASKLRAQIAEFMYGRSTQRARAFNTAIDGIRQRMLENMRNKSGQLVDGIGNVIQAAQPDPGGVNPLTVDFSASQGRTDNRG